MPATSIASVRGRQILDSRGRPTVEVDVVLGSGAFGRAAVPAGASTGSAEACELRDGDPAVHAGRGVLSAVANVDGAIAQVLAGADALDQNAVDARMRDCDGTARLSKLGANAVLGTSLAVCRAAAAALGLPLHEHIRRLAGSALRAVLPVPMVNILSGGLHAGRGMDVQDFLAVPVRARSMTEALHDLLRVRQAAADLLSARGASVLLADEGGLAPGFEDGRAALVLMVESMEHAGLVPGRDMAIAIDVAATTLQDGAHYRFAREGRVRSAAEVVETIAEWARDFPLVSVEDALGEEDWDHWRTLTSRCGTALQLIGDDLFTTDPARLQRGIEMGVANAVLVKPNQNGTLTGTLEVLARARQHGYAAIVSARSGETEDAFIADLATGTGAGQIKIGSLRGSERLAKYNQLLRLEQTERLAYAGFDGTVGLRPATRVGRAATPDR